MTTTTTTATAKAARPCQKGQKGHEKPARVKIYGHSATAILRWMGAQGWNLEDAAVAMASLGGHMIKDSSIEAGLYDGTVAPKYGKLPVLTTWQKKKINEARM